MDAAELRIWRKTERERLLAERLAVPPDTLLAWRERIDRHIEFGFPGLGAALIGFCWPFQNEYDARFLLARLRKRGARTALPVVVAPKTPLVFREWHPGVPLARGVYDIPYPAAGESVVPTVAIVPMNGFDRDGYRLGYGGGYFDRTLAAMSPRPTVIGVTFERAAMETIHPQAYDIPMDYVVTERGVYRRDPEGLAFLGEPRSGGPAGLASPVCYADELDPGRHGGA
jgi:5-formyltetrahydrofolate cyclo-ligase